MPYDTTIADFMIAQQRQMKTWAPASHQYLQKTWYNPGHGRPQDRVGHTLHTRRFILKLTCPFQLSAHPRLDLRHGWAAHQL
jgi:hypothetical protein